MNGDARNPFLFRSGGVVLVSHKIFQVLWCSLVGGADLRVEALVLEDCEAGEEK